MSDEVSAAGRSWAFGSAIRTRRALVVQGAVCVLGLLIADVLAFASAGVLFFHGALLLGPAPITLVSPELGIGAAFGLLASIFVLSQSLFGSYRRRRLFWNEASTTTISLALCGVLNLLALRFAPNADDGVIVRSWVFVIIAIPVFRQFARWSLDRASVWRIPTALIGSGAGADRAYDALRRPLSLGFDINLQIASAKCTLSEPIPDVLRVDLQNPAVTARRLRDAGYLHAILVPEVAQFVNADSLTGSLVAEGIDVTLVPPRRDRALLGLTHSYYFGQDLVLLQGQTAADRKATWTLKRVADIVLSILLLILLTPMFLIVGLIIKLREGGDVIFSQPRVGLNGREFLCHKFRTMDADAEGMLLRWKDENSPIYREYVRSNFKLRDDPRVTSFGRWLRRTSLDEFPQLVNVLMGDMSLVGPRPLLEREVAEYGATIALYQQVRPGMTGLWQISGRSHTSFQERVTADAWYIKHWSFWYDFIILIETAGVLLMRADAY